MEINNTQPVNSQVPASTVNSTTQPPVNEEQTQAQETDLSTESTVNISTEAQNLSSETETSTAATPITSSEEAEESVAQFQQDAANDPTSTQSAQSNSLTSDEVERLIG